MRRRSWFLLGLCGLAAGCLRPPGGQAAPGRALAGPVVVEPFLLEAEDRRPLRSVLAWPQRPVQVTLPDGEILLLRVFPGSAGVRIREETSGRETTGDYRQPLALRVGGRRLEFVVEYP